VSRAEFDSLARRVEQMDVAGTRGVSGLSIQLGGLVRDLAELKTDTRLWQGNHEQEHEQEQRDRRSARRWLVGVLIAAVAAVDGPVLTIVLARGH
jgi:hypothetical protein